MIYWTKCNFLPDSLFIALKNYRRSKQILRFENGCFLRSGQSEAEACVDSIANTEDPEEAVVSVVARCHLQTLHRCSYLLGYFTNEKKYLVCDKTV